MDLQDFQLQTEKDYCAIYEIEAQLIMHYHKLETKERYNIDKNT